MGEMNLEAIFTIGILKGIKSQIYDTDVKLALDKSIEVFAQIADGYILQKPQVEEEVGGEG